MTLTLVTSRLGLPSDEYVQRLVSTHLDPVGGTPYWLRRDHALGADAPRRVSSFTDFKRLVGFRDLDDQAAFEQDARTLPVEQFVPRTILDGPGWLWVSQTGGTTGPPKHGHWHSSYWAEVLAFSDEFLDAHGVPRGANWLFIGPMGPHTTGRLVVAIAEHRGGRCFSIDLDPRIVKIYGTEGMTAAYDRYIRHIWDQVVPILKYQDVDVVFCTSRLLEMLPDHVDGDRLRRLRGVVHAGTTMDRDTEQLLREEVLAGVPLVGIYGTSTTGISYQKPPEPDDDYRVVYIPSSPFIVLEVVDAVGAVVADGEEGDVATYRLTEDCLIPGFCERDRAVATAPYGAFADAYPWSWIADPYSPEFTVEGRVEGVY